MGVVLLLVGDSSGAADPSGATIRHYRDFVTLTGSTGAAEVPFSLNDANGRWTINVTDLATGVSTARTIMVHE